MIILTGANSDVAKNYAGESLDHFAFRFSLVINKTAKNARKFGYTPAVYDLGELGFGEPFQVDDPSFVGTGHYKLEPIKGYKSKSLFKPALVRTCLEKYNDLTVYLDGDAELRRSIDEIQTDDYDIGVTIRDKSELETEWYEKYKEIVRFVNAGVIFFNHTPATAKFVDVWEELTNELGNDQMALNKLTCPEHYPEIGSIHVLNGVRVKYFSCAQYNFYYFMDKNPWGAKIMHFKGDVRHLYPFDWKKRLLASMYVPLKFLANKLRNFS